MQMLVNFLKDDRRQEGVKPRYPISDRRNILSLFLDKKKCLSCDEEIHDYCKWSGIYFVFDSFENLFLEIFIVVF